MESEEEKKGRIRRGQQWSWMGYAYLSVLDCLMCEHAENCQSRWHALKYLNEATPFRKYMCDTSCWKYMKRQPSAARRSSLANEREADRKLKP